jgi:hypothetical protein
MMATKARTMTQVEALYLNNAANAFPRSNDYPVTYGSLDAYGWPGGYPIYYLDRHDDTLCPGCAQAILEAHRADDLLVALGSELGYDQFDEDGIALGADPVLSAMRDAIGPESTRDVPIAYGVHYEGPPIQCEECGAEIPSAYGDPDSPDED